MPATNETLAYVAEVQGPTVQAVSASRNAIRQYSVVLHKVEQQNAIYARLLQTAELAETDEQLDQLFGEAFMRVAAVRVTQAELARHLRDLALREAALVKINQRIITRVNELAN